MLDTVKSIREILECKDVAHTYCGEVFKRIDKTWTNEFIPDAAERKIHNFRFTCRGTMISISCRPDDKWSVTKLTKTGKDTKVCDIKAVIALVSKDNLFTNKQLKKVNELMTFDVTNIPSSQI